MTSKHTHAASDSIAYIPTLGEWGALLRKHGPKIVNSLWRSGNRQDCEDAVQSAVIKIAGLDPDHRLEEELEPKTEAQWVGFVQMHARSFLSHRNEREAKWVWAGNTHKELRDAYSATLADRTLGERPRAERLRNIRRQTQYLVAREEVRNQDAQSPIERLSEKIRRQAVREMVDLVCGEYGVSDRDRDVFVRAVLDGEDAQHVADDLLKGNRSHLYIIVCRVKEKLVKHGRTAFKRGWVLAEEKLWRLGA